METWTKIKIDEWCGRPLVVLLNIVARILGKLLSIDHSLDKTPRKIVVCKFMGMGSIIQATPLLQTLGKSFTDAKLFFITSQTNRNLLKSITPVHETLVVDDRSFASTLLSVVALLRRLWKERPDLYIDLETYSYLSTAIATMSCARNRFGFYRLERNIRLGVYTHMMFFNSRAPIAQAYLQMARLIGCRELVTDLFPFQVSAADRDSCRRKLTAMAGHEVNDYIVINPNASDLRVERRWRKENFSELIDRLNGKLPAYDFVVTGSQTEASFTGEIIQELSEDARARTSDSAGQFSLGELFALIEGSLLVITNDTGPMHIAFSLFRPTVCLFGPASPTQYGQNPNAFGVYKNIYCSPCVHDFLKPPCGGDNQCMKMISVDEVLQLCSRILSPTPPGVGIQVEPQLRFTKLDKETSLGIIGRAS